MSYCLRITPQRMQFLQKYAKPSGNKEREERPHVSRSAVSDANDRIQQWLTGSNTASAENGADNPRPSATISSTEERAEESILELIRISTIPQRNANGVGNEIQYSQIDETNELRKNVTRLELQLKNKNEEITRLQLEMAQLRDEMQSYFMEFDSIKNSLIVQKSELRMQVDTLQEKLNSAKKQLKELSNVQEIELVMEETDPVYGQIISFCGLQYKAPKELRKFVIHDLAMLQPQWHQLLAIMKQPEGIKRFCGFQLFKFSEICNGYNLNSVYLFLQKLEPQDGGNDILREFIRHLDSMIEFIRRPSVLALEEKKETLHKIVLSFFYNKILIV